jgi:CHASE2 domain-containing sensor protein
LNIEEVQNVIFEGALAASCRIQLAGEPPASLLANIENNNPEVIGLDLLRIG